MIQMIQIYTKFYLRKIEIKQYEWENLCEPKTVSVDYIKIAFNIEQ